MVLERPEPGEIVWRCTTCNKIYRTEEVDHNSPTCRDIVCRAPLERTRL